MTQLYALIKKESEYFHQNDYHRDEKTRELIPFRVALGGGKWLGGVGGNYPLEDLELFVIDQGEFLRVGT